jgi:hemolysin-activating ACP:hemolysin acyltransferase
VEILLETDESVFGREKDQLREIGVLMTIAMLSANYGREMAFDLFERLQSAVASNCYAVLYERGSRDSQTQLPVGFVTWGFLSKPCGAIFSERLRQLRPSEHKSGPHLWVIDLVAPIGHGVKLQEAFETVHQSHPNYQATRLRNGKWRVEVFKNKVAAHKAAAASK